MVDHSERKYRRAGVFLLRRDEALHRMKKSALCLLVKTKKYVFAEMCLRKLANREIG